MAQPPFPQQLSLQKLINNAGMQLDEELMTGLPVTVEAPSKRWLRLIADNAGNLSFNAWRDHRREHAELFFTGFTDQLVASGHLELDESPVPVAAVASIAQPPASGPSPSPSSALRARTPRQDNDEEEEISSDKQMDPMLPEIEEEQVLDDEEEDQLEDEEDRLPWTYDPAFPPDPAYVEGFLKRMHEMGRKLH